MNDAKDETIQAVSSQAVSRGVITSIRDIYPYLTVITHTISGMSITQVPNPEYVQILPIYGAQIAT